MSLDVLTVVTPTIGDSAGHLNRQAFDLREFTKLRFRQIVSDDGTNCGHIQSRQRNVCEMHGMRPDCGPMLWTENPGPTYGIGHNLNHAFSFVETPWAFCVEDGLRPSMGWLETALDAIERIGNRTWEGHKVGMIGTSSIQDWHLAMAGVLPTHRPFMDFTRKVDAECYSAFWGGAQWPNWNDGYWCWKRLLPALKRVCDLPEADAWPSPHPGFFRDIVRGISLPEPYEDHARMIGYRPFDAWPANRHAACGWFPGAFMLVNMEAWRQVGRFREGCTFFEGHLGIRMAQAGYVSLCLHFPPWSHFEGIGFANAPWVGKKPRDHQPCDGPDGILQRDFGCNGEGHVDLYNLVYDRFPKDKQARIDKELAGVELAMTEGWEKWL